MEEVTLRCAARVYGGGYAAHTMRIGKGPAGLRLEGFAASDREVSLRARVRSALRAG